MLRTPAWPRPPGRASKSPCDGGAMHVSTGNVRSEKPKAGGPFPEGRGPRLCKGPSRGDDERSAPNIDPNALHPWTRRALSAGSTTLRRDRTVIHPEAGGHPPTLRHSWMIAYVHVPARPAGRAARSGSLFGAVERGGQAATCGLSSARYRTAPPRRAPWRMNAAEVGPPPATRCCPGEAIAEAQGLTGGVGAGPRVSTFPCPRLRQVCRRAKRPRTGLLSPSGFVQHVVEIRRGSRRTH